MEQSPKSPTRKKFLVWGATVLSSFTVLKFFSGNKPEKTETVKMLTRDGKLVEIDKKLLVPSGRKISNEELQNWVVKSDIEK